MTMTSEKFDAVEVQHIGLGEQVFLAQHWSAERSFDGRTIELKNAWGNVRASASFSEKDGWVFRTFKGDGDMKDVVRGVKKMTTLNNLFKEFHEEVQL